jgi:hypothetical protein
MRQRLIPPTFACPRKSGRPTDLKSDGRSGADEAIVMRVRCFADASGQHAPPPGGVRWHGGRPSPPHQQRHQQQRRGGTSSVVNTGVENDEGVHTQAYLDLEDAVRYSASPFSHPDLLLTLPSRRALSSPHDVPLATCAGAEMRWKEERRRTPFEIRVWTSLRPCERSAVRKNPVRANSCSGVWHVGCA